MPDGTNLGTRAGGPRAVTGQLAFARPQDVTPPDEPGGPKRARAHEIVDVPVDGETYDLQPCQVRDCAARPEFTPDLKQHGFAHVGLESVAGLSAVLERVRSEGFVSEEHAAAVRRCLRGVSLPLADGTRLRLLLIAREGFIMRRAGPNGMPLDAVGPSDAMNNHQAARAVHIDQDVDGTPLRQLLRGTAPYLFQHDSPTHANARSPLHVLNLWIPLDQRTAPLALLDRRTFDRPQHQLRFGLPTDTFLERKDHMSVNDIWAVLHDQEQDWYFTSDMDATRGYVFETLSTAHGSFVLPGEEVAERLYRELEGILAGNEPGNGELVDTGDDETPTSAMTPPLRHAVDAMRGLVEEAREGTGGDWATRVREAMDRVVRKSLEMRIVALVVPDKWPWRWL